MTLDRARSALVLVDYQTRLMPSIDQAESVLRNGVFLAEAARALDIPVIGTEQNPQGLGPNDERIRALCATTLAKMHFDACADGLVSLLRGNGHAIDQVVIAGCEAHVCLMQSALGLLRAGFDVHVVPTACGSRRREDKALAIQRLAQRGAVLASCEMTAFEWLQACTDPHFKDILRLVKALPL